MASANRIGTGKLNSSDSVESRTVLVIILPNVGAVKNRSNHCRPTHLLPKKPCAGL